jgi:hypothetical protein
MQKNFYKPINRDEAGKQAQAAFFRNYPGWCLFGKRA